MAEHLEDGPSAGLRRASGSQVVSFTPPSVLTPVTRTPGASTHRFAKASIFDNLGIKLWISFGLLRELKKSAELYVISLLLLNPYLALRNQHMKQLDYN